MHVPDNQNNRPEILLARKGILLAGGLATRLYPVTKVSSKQLLPVYNKPMVYYPLSTLMLAGIREILLVSTPQHLPLYEQLLGTGAQWGITLKYEEQRLPRGIAEAVQIGSGFLAGAPACLILGDNIFYGNDIGHILRRADQRAVGATVFAYPVKDPQRYGIVEFDKRGKVLSLEEKPSQPRSTYAITGLYFFDGKVAEHVQSIMPSKRGELEITDLNRLYLDQGSLHVEVMGRGIAWFDTGTHHSLLQASTFVEAVEERQGTMIACPEEIAWRKGFISTEQLARQAAMMESSYGNYLLQLAEGDRFFSDWGM